VAPSEPEGSPEQSPEPAPAAEQRGRRRWLWLGLVILIAALLGVVVGVGVAIQGRSLSPAGDAVSRPTFVISGSVSPQPSPGGSPSPAGVSPPATTTTTPAATTTAGGADYVVQPGDTLRSIAQNVYGDADQWPRIYDANRDRIGPDPDSLQVGMHLQLP
jgi:nucleoid-associated protein YgaU